MRTVFQWLDSQGCLMAEQVIEKPLPDEEYRPARAMRLRAAAHRVYVDGRMVKDNCGDCPAALTEG
jgi:hypothetical protein